MTILSMIMGFLAKVFAEVFTNVLQTPAVETSVENVEGPLSTPATTVDELCDQYKWVRDRG